MRDLVLPIEAVWLVGVEILVVRLDRDVVPGVQFPNGMLFSVHLGLQRKWLTVTTFVQDRLIAVDPQIVGPTTLADGVYYMAPPWLWATAEGWPVDKIRGFPMTVI